MSYEIVILYNRTLFFVLFFLYALRVVYKILCNNLMLIIIAVIIINLNFANEFYVSATKKQKEEMKHRMIVYSIHR